MIGAEAGELLGHRFCANFCTGEPSQAHLQNAYGVTGRVLGRGMLFRLFEQRDDIKEVNTHYEENKNYLYHGAQHR